MNELQKAVHAAPAGAVASRIGVDISTGVPAHEVEERRRAFGENRLPAAAKQSLSGSSPPNSEASAAHAPEHVATPLPVRAAPSLDDLELLLVEDEASARGMLWIAHRSTE